VNIKIKPLLRGILSYIPGLSTIVTLGTGGTISSRYCYSVWLRHIVMAYRNGLSTFPETVAELGPGDSLGTGLAALLSGANKYCALDVVKHANIRRNLEIFDELVELFKERQRIPDQEEFPRAKPVLESYEFPKTILTDERLNKALRQERIDSIRNALSNPDDRNEQKIQIVYFVPWYEPKVLKMESIDMIYSQAVLEHVSNLDHTYHALHRWLKPNGFISNQIDFSAHDTAQEWNGHWSHSDFVWKLIKGKRPYLLNREPHSKHIDLLQKYGFEVVCDTKTRDTSGIKREALAAAFKNMSDDDLTTRAAFIQAIKRPHDSAKA
jgi:hypothetical protein